MEQTFSPEPANFTENSSQPTPIPITQEKKSWAIPVLSMAMIVLAASLVYVYFENQKLSQIVRETSLSKVIASPDTIVATPPVEVEEGQKVAAGELADDFGLRPVNRRGVIEFDEGDGDLGALVIERAIEVLLGV